MGEAAEGKSGTCILCRLDRRESDASSRALCSRVRPVCLESRGPASDFRKPQAPQRWALLHRAVAPQVLEFVHTCSGWKVLRFGRPRTPPPSPPRGPSPGTHFD